MVVDQEVHVGDTLADGHDVEGDTIADGPEHNVHVVVDQEGRVEIATEKEALEDELRQIRLDQTQ